MRSVCFLLLLSLVAVAAQPAPASPPTADQKGPDGMCQLTGMSFNGGLSLVGNFNPNTFSYQATYSGDWSSIGAQTLSVTHMDAGSNTQVWFNGRAVNTKQLNNALTATSKTSASLAGSAGWRVGNNKIQLLVGCEVHIDGMEMCEYQYEIDINKPGTQAPPASGGFVTGDPQFVGLRGQNYQVHGVSGEVYNIVSDDELQYNSRFVFLSSGECPIVNGRRMKGCWSHPGSYLGELGLKTKAGERIEVLTGPAKQGFKSLTLNGRPLEIGDVVMLQDGGFVARNSTHLASVQIGNWDFAFENSDRFVNQRVRVIDSRILRSHGLLGQTWRETTYPNSIKYIQGSVDDYTIRDGDLFGDAFLYNAHN